LPSMLVAFNIYTIYYKHIPLATFRSFL